MSDRVTFTNVAPSTEAGVTDVRVTLQRFVRWGLWHGPLWGVIALAVTLLVAAVTGYPGSTSQLAVAALFGGLLGGPVIGAVVGVACIAADRAPKWLIDAPDYVAVITVVAIVAVVAWPSLGLGDHGITLGIATVLSLGFAPAADAAAYAPRLLYPSTADAPGSSAS